MPLDMKKRIGIAVFLSSLLFMINFYGGQSDVKTISNPKRPSDPNAGRIVELQEVMRVDDKNEGYFFQYPHNIKIAPDGGFFAVDKNQFLKFDRNGNFKGNFFRLGQGPGELQFIENYIFQGDNIVFFDRSLTKIMYLTQDGELVSELKIRVPGLDTFLTKYGGNYLFFKSTPPETKGVPEIVILDENLITVFPRPYMIMKAGNSSFIDPRARLLKCFRDKDTVFLTHTPEYLIKLFNLNEGKVLFQFNRDYERVKPDKESKKFAPGGNYGKISIGGAWFEVPVAKYHLDIQMIFMVKNKLWVITSTVDKKKGILVDVFDRDGNYVDNFYLDYPEGVVPYSVNSWIKAASDDSIFTVERGEAEELFIVKNRIVDSFLGK
jgi:hypothetical protein